MDDRVVKITELLKEAGETHHKVYRLEDGADEDWASWYSDWLINHSELPGVLGKKPVRSELTYVLVKLGKDYESENPETPWQAWYAERLVKHFASG